MTKKVRYIHILCDINVHHWWSTNDVFGLPLVYGLQVEPPMQGPNATKKVQFTHYPLVCIIGVHHDMQLSMGIGQCGIQWDMPYMTKKVQYVMTNGVTYTNVHGHICMCVEMKTVHGRLAQKVEMKTARLDECPSSCMVVNGQALVNVARIMNNHQREVQYDVVQGRTQLVVVDTHKVWLGVHMVMDTCNHVLHNGWGGMTMNVWFDDEQLVSIARLLMKLHEDDEPREAVQMVDHKSRIKQLIKMVKDCDQAGLSHGDIVAKLRNECSDMSTNDHWDYMAAILNASNTEFLIEDLHSLMRRMPMVDHKELVFDLIQMVDGATANGVAFNKLAMETRTELPGEDYRHYNLVDELLEELGGMNEDDIQAYTAIILAAHNPTTLVIGLKELLGRVLI